MSNDPFYIIKDELERQVAALQIKMESWQGLLRSTNTATDPAFKAVHEELLAKLPQSMEVCRKLRTSVQLIINERHRFGHVDDRELDSRKQHVMRLERQLTAMAVAFNSPEAKGKVQSDQKKELQSIQTARAAGGGAAGATATAARGPNAYTQANTDFMGQHAQAQMQLRKEQDVHLDKLQAGLERLQEMGNIINDELKEQSAIMDDVSDDIDRTQNKMDTVQKHAEKILGMSDKCQLITIFVLVLTFIIVAIVAMYVLTS